MQNRSYYKNIKYNISFFHDFNKYISLEKQLPKVQEKYCRRINRFYNVITKPTLFIRYISDEKDEAGDVKELVYIENNFADIQGLIKSFNKNNDILFIANEGVISKKFKIYNVQKDENDSVARNPICKNEILYKVFRSIDIPNKQKNIKRYEKKEKNKRRFCNRLKRKIVYWVKKYFVKNIYTKSSIKSIYF